MAARKKAVKRRKTARKTSTRRAPARKKTVKRKTSSAVKRRAPARKKTVKRKAAGTAKRRAPARKTVKARKKAIKQVPQRGAPKQAKPVPRARPPKPVSASELPMREQDKPGRPAAGIEEPSSPGSTMGTQPGERTAANEPASDSRSDIDDVGGGLSPGLDKEGGS